MLCRDSGWRASLDSLRNEISALDGASEERLFTRSLAPRRPTHAAFRQPDEISALGGASEGHLFRLESRTQSNKGSVRLLNCRCVLESNVGSGSRSLRETLNKEWSRLTMEYGPFEALIHSESRPQSNKRSVRLLNCRCVLESNVGSGSRSPRETLNKEWSRLTMEYEPLEALISLRVSHAVE